MGDGMIPMRDFKVISTYRGNRNLQDILVHSNIHKNPSTLENVTFLKFLMNPPSGSPVGKTLVPKLRTYFMEFNAYNARSFILGTPKIVRRQD